MGRYISTDPVELEEAGNLYIYALNNPIIFIDFLGLSPSAVIDKKKCALLIARAMDVCGEDFDRAKEKWHQNLQDCKQKANDCFYCLDSSKECEDFEDCSSKNSYAQQLCFGKICASKPEPWEQAIEEVSEECKKALKDIPLGCLKTPKKFPNKPMP